MEDTIEKYHPLLQNMNDFDFSRKCALDKWSHKEELGHLINSTQNNIQRFIRVQYEENGYILYQPDNWVALNSYKDADVTKTTLFITQDYIKHMTHHLENIPKS